MNGPIDRRMRSILAKPTITMYVRRGAVGETRNLSLHPIPRDLFGFAQPQEVTEEERLIESGFSIDGDSVTLAVEETSKASFDPATGTMSVSTESARMGDFGQVETFPNIRRPIAKALHEVQSAIVKWLRSHGYDVRIA